MTRSRTNLKVTPERREIFLRAFIESFGNFSHACRVASPHSKDTVNPPCRSTFLALKENDPEFRAALADADEQIKDNAREEIRKLAVEGETNFVYQKAQQVFNADGTPAVQTKKNVKAILALARFVDPQWNERHVHEHQGQIEHKLPSSVEALNLSCEERQKVREVMGLLGRGEEQKAITHQPEPTAEPIDADYEDVEEDAIVA